MRKHLEKKGLAAPPSEADLAFETEVLKKHPSRKEILRFDFPRGIDDAHAVYMFPMTGRDELVAADMAEANMTASERKSVVRAADAERREAIRLSIVGVVHKSGSAFEYRHIDQSVPFMEIDAWSSKAWYALRTFFGTLNGLSVAALGKAERGARKAGSALLLVSPDDSELELSDD
jgi:hypothetical protein